MANPVSCAGAVLLSGMIFLAGAGSAHACEKASCLLDARDQILNVNLADKQAGEASLVFKLDAETAKRDQALLLEGADSKAGSILVNGREVRGDPARRHGGTWLPISAEYFQKGENRLEIRGAKGATEGILFPLDSPSEADHFGFFIETLSPEAEPPRHPQQNLMDVLHCRLEITLDMAGATIPEAELTLTGKALDSALTQCVLDLDDNGGALAVTAVDSGEGTSALSYTHDGANDRLLIDLPGTYSTGDEFTVRVSYSGTPNPGRGYLHGTHGGVPVIYTESQPYDARTWFPCKDVPSDKFTYEALITVPDNSYNGYPLFPVTNGRLDSTTDNGTTKTFHWIEEFEVASYLVSITCSNYRSSTAEYTALDGTTTMDVTHYMYPELYDGDEVHNTIDTMEFFAETFGEYPFLTEKYATAGWNYNWGMEHQTCTSMPDANLSVPYHRRSIHELAHMWFGDMVTYHTYDHLWLAEGWATYCEALMNGHLYGDQAYHSMMNGFSVSDSRPLVHPDQDAFDGLTFPTAYRKGAWVIHMLRHALGDEDFFAGTRAYLNDPDFQYGTADSDDYQAAYEGVVGEDLSWFFDQWLYRTSRPAYEWNWTTRPEGEDTILEISIQQAQADDVYTMPVDFEVDLGSGGSQTVTVLNDRRTQSFDINLGPATPLSVEFDPENWILDTNQQVGVPQQAPTLLSVIGNAQQGTFDIRWVPVGESGVAGHRVYTSSDGKTGWTLAADESELDETASELQLAGYAAGEEVYVRVAAVALGRGPYSDLYGGRLGGNKVLVVDGYDRWNSQGFSGGENHVFGRVYGQAIGAAGRAFDSIANEEAGSAASLGSYPAVAWFLGDESTADETFSDAEQDLVEDYLEGGGALFVSGNEIGWDLENRGSATDTAFYHDYLKAGYAADDSNDYTLQGPGGSSIFGTSIYEFGTPQAFYTPGYPDVLTPIGSDVALEYSAGVVAAVQYQGGFGTARAEGKLVYLGFGFETVEPESAREEIMAAVLQYFGAANVQSFILF